MWYIRALVGIIYCLLMIRGVQRVKRYELNHPDSWTIPYYIYTLGTVCTLYVLDFVFATSYLVPKSWLLS